MRESIHKLYTRENNWHFLTILGLLRQWQEDAKVGVNDVDTNGLCIYIAKSLKGSSNDTYNVLLTFDSLLLETVGDKIFPFGGLMAYSIERRTETAHLNPQRIEWVEMAIDSIHSYLKESI